MIFNITIFFFRVMSNGRATLYYMSVIFSYLITQCIAQWTQNIIERLTLKKIVPTSCIFWYIKCEIYFSFRYDKGNRRQIPFCRQWEDHKLQFWSNVLVYQIKIIKINNYNNHIFFLITLTMKIIFHHHNNNLPALGTILIILDY